MDRAALDQATPVNILDIDVKRADALGVPKTAVAINDMAVHPLTADIYISVARIDNFVSEAASMKVAQDAAIQLMHLDALSVEKQARTSIPISRRHSGHVLCSRQRSLHLPKWHHHPQ